MMEEENSKIFEGEDQRERQPRKNSFKEILLNKTKENQWSL